MDADMTDLVFCDRCGDNTPSRLELTPKLPHHGKLVCVGCGKWRRWVAKPETDATKYRRPAVHKDLVHRFSRGFCELCLLRESELRDGVVLEAHHVVEYHDDGDASRENVWILCTKCHRLVTWMRKYVGHNEPIASLVSEVAKELTRHDA